jgi:hypothetical protein
MNFCFSRRNLRSHRFVVDDSATWCSSPNTHHLVPQCSCVFFSRDNWRQRSWATAVCRLTLSPCQSSGSVFCSGPVFFLTNCFCEVDLVKHGCAGMRHHVVGMHGRFGGICLPAGTASPAIFMFIGVVSSNPSLINVRFYINQALRRIPTDWSWTVNTARGADT